MASDDRREIDRAWREQMLVKITEVGVNQDHLVQALKEYADASEKRFLRLDKAVFGNGHGQGLVDQVRGLSGRWATGIAFVTFVATLVANKMFSVVAKAIGAP